MERMGLPMRTQRKLPDFVNDASNSEVNMPTVMRNVSIIIMIIIIIIMIIIILIIVIVIIIIIIIIVIIINFLL